MQTCDVAVVGAGIVGAACAYELSQAGLRVVLLEPNAVASGATNLGFGSLSVLHHTPALLTLTRYGLWLWDRLVPFMPADAEYARCGTLWLATDQHQFEIAKRRRETLHLQSVRTQLLDPHQTAEAEPELAHPVVGALLVPDDGTLRASHAAEFLVHSATSHGALHLRRRAVAIRHHEVTLEDGSLLIAGNIVNAAGNAASLLSPDFPLTYKKSHLLVVQTRSHCVRHRLAELAAEGSVALEVRQNTLASDQSIEVWIGSSTQPVNSPEEPSPVEPKIIAQLLRRAIEMLPLIGHAKPLRSWTGVRASTPDGLPLIGRTPGNPSLFAAVGHDNYGATAALATAKLIVDELLCQTPEIDPSPYLANRFEGKNSLHAK